MHNVMLPEYGCRYWATPGLPECHYHWLAIMISHSSCRNSIPCFSIQWWQHKLNSLLNYQIVLWKFRVMHVNPAQTFLKVNSKTLICFYDLISHDTDSAGQLQSRLALHKNYWHSCSPDAAYQVSNKSCSLADNKHKHSYNLGSKSSVSSDSDRDISVSWYWMKWILYSIMKDVESSVRNIPGLSQQEQIDEMMEVFVSYWYSAIHTLVNTVSFNSEQCSSKWKQKCTKYWFHYSKNRCNLPGAD